MNNISGLQWKKSETYLIKGMTKVWKKSGINLIQGMTVRRLRSTPGMKAMPGGLTGRTVVANISNHCIGDIVDFSNDCIDALLTDTRSSTSTGPAPREWRT